MSASDASKPYIDATERSIELNFRSLEYQNDRLNKALSRNERMMHQRVWKMKTFHDLEEPKTWQSRSDLQTYLGALAVMGRQKGGGRVFSKEKHSYFDHDDSHAMQQTSQHSGGRPAGRAAADDGEADDEEVDARMDRPGKKAEQREEQKQQHDDDRRQPLHADEDEGMEEEAEFSVPLGASADISDYINERLQSRQRERTIDISAPPPAHPTGYSTRGSVMLGAAHLSFLAVDEHKDHFSPRRSPLLATPGRSGATTPHHTASSQHASPQFHPGGPRSPSTHTPLRGHTGPVAAAGSLDAQALSLVSAIHFHHSEQMRQLHYTGGKQLVRRRAAVVEGKNLFAGLKDKFHNTFTEIREMAEEDREEKRREEMALNKRRKGKGKPRPADNNTGQPGDTTRHSTAADGSTTRRPATTASASTARTTARPTLPSASGFRPATSAGLMGRQSSVAGGAAVVERRTWPDAFALPDSVDTFIRLAPIVRLPRQGNVADAMQPFSLASKPTSPSMRGAGARRASLSAPAGRSGNQLQVPAPITTGDLSTLGGSVTVQADETGSPIGSDGRLDDEGDSSTSGVVRPPSVYKQQQHAHMRANFIRFLSHTEPQLWTPTPVVKRRDGDQASGRDRGKSRGIRASLIQPHSGSPVKAG